MVEFLITFLLEKGLDPILFWKLLHSAEAISIQGTQ